MSIGVIIKAPEGLVLASESRTTVTVTNNDDKTTFPVHFDNTTKLYSFKSKPKIGVVTWGQGVIGKRSIESLMPDFEAELQEKKESLSVYRFAERLKGFFLRRWNNAGKQVEGASVTFYVCGFDKNVFYGKVYAIEIPGRLKPQEQHKNDQFGFSMGGQHDIAYRIFAGYDPGILTFLQQKLNLNQDQIDGLKKDLSQFQLTVPIDAMSLQDCIDWAVFLIRSTITAQSLIIGIQGCGGPIDIATITPGDGFRHIQRKELVGERKPTS